METLSRDYLERHQGLLPVLTVGPLEPAPERVIQFGEGNFLRGFVEWLFHEIIRRGLFNGRIVVVQPLREGLVERLNAQQGVYTLLRRGLRGGRPVEEADIITVVSRGINPFTHFGEFIECARNPDLRFMVSNTTEAGIVYQPVLLPEGECPATFPAKAALFLHERYKAFAGAADKGLIILPCELIERNGAVLRECVLRHAADWRLEPGFREWIERNNRFCDTLVDRIVPGHPSDEMPALAAKLGYLDPMLVASELFHLWVIGDDPAARTELPFTQAGLNVIWAESLAPYRTLKVRILNGLHTTFSIPAFLSGMNTVLDGLNDSLIDRFIMKALDEEIIPSLDVPEETAKAYAAQVLERFRNPFIKHRLLSIASNSVSKYRVRVLPTVLRFMEKKRAVPPALTLALAALISFYQGKRDSARTSVGSRLGVPYPIADEPEVLDFFAQRDELFTADSERLCRETLSRAAFWGLDLARLEGFLPAVIQQFEMLENHGVRQAMRQVVGP